MIFIYMQMVNYCLSKKDTDFITCLLISFFLFIVSMEIWIPSLAVQIEAISEFNIWVFLAAGRVAGWWGVGLLELGHDLLQSQSQSVFQTWKKNKKQNRSLGREEKTKMPHSLFFFLCALILDKAIAKIRENRIIMYCTKALYS